MPNRNQFHSKGHENKHQQPTSSDPDKPVSEHKKHEPTSYFPDKKIIREKVNNLKVH